MTDKMKSEAKYVFDDKVREVYLQWAALDQGPVCYSTGLFFLLMLNLV